MKTIKQNFDFIFDAVTTLIIYSIGGVFVVGLYVFLFYLGASTLFCLISVVDYIISFFYDTGLTAYIKSNLDLIFNFSKITAEWILRIFGLGGGFIYGCFEIRKKWGEYKLSE